MIIADLHIHSRYAQACSKQITIEKLEQWAKVKGIDLLGTGDFQHPLWRKELDTLKEDEHGILRTKTGFPFLWQTEISFVYTQGGKGRRIHHLILAPNKEVVDQITEALGKKGRLDYDGRPIFGFSSIELVEMMRQISKDIEIIPAHAWTPWYAIFGSKSGFNSIQECFQEKSKHIHAIETGMSSDPEMNWRLRSLDNINLVSFSDSHSFWPWRLGREATVFDTKLEYRDIINAIRSGKGLVSTVETLPEYGKYHLDGHRNCNIVLTPEQTKKHNGICPVCKRAITIGVLNRVEELADRPEGFIPKGKPDFKRVIPLTELIAKSLNTRLLTGKKVWDIYNALTERFGSEFDILLNVKENELVEKAGKPLAKLLIKNRNDKLNMRAGYDGVYGEIEPEGEEKKHEIKKPEQKSLGDF